MNIQNFVILWQSDRQRALIQAILGYTMEQVVLSSGLQESVAFAIKYENISLVELRQILLELKATPTEMSGFEVVAALDQIMISSYLSENGYRPSRDFDWRGGHAGIYLAEYDDDQSLTILHIITVHKGVEPNIQESVSALEVLEGLLQFFED